MKPFTIREIVEATKGKLLNQNAGLLNTVITGVSTDTRTINQGDLFIPLVGENFDGHYFLDQAIEKGGAAILVHRKDSQFFPDLYPEVPTIKVDDTLKALQDLAAYRRSQFDIPVVAITGSNGKTTTKDMVALVLSQRYNVLKTEGNFNNEIGLPHTLFRLEDYHEAAVLEMGMSALGEIHRLAEIARPSIAIITNIGVSHLENLGSRENILKAKMEIFDFFTPEDKAILNKDDEFLGNIKEEFPFEVEYYGIGDNADIRAENIRTLESGGIAYDLIIDQEVYPMELGIPGRHNVLNSMAAVAVGRVMGIAIEDIAKALKSFRTGSMRLNIFTTDLGVRVIDDVYNASPDSMKASIEILKDLTGGRKIAVLGDILELGDYSETGHTDVGKTVAEKGIDILITVGSLSRYIGQGAHKSGMDAQSIKHFSCNKDVTEYLETILSQEDTILVKGSRGMKMEEIVEYLANWGNRR